MTRANEKHNDMPEQDAPPPVPRWVKVFALVLGIILLSMIILHASGHRMGGHGEHGIEKHGEQSVGQSAMHGAGGSV